MEVYMDMGLCVWVSVTEVLLRWQLESPFYHCPSDVTTVHSFRYFPIGYKAGKLAIIVRAASVIRAHTQYYSSPLQSSVFWLGAFSRLATVTPLLKN